MVCNLFPTLFRNSCKTLSETNYNPAIGWDNTTHQNAAGVNPLYFNNFLFNPV
ncbi:MAG: hypothetical protein IK065_06515 [Neisseriaceae bacterium]|nr:hypothetical protein [Neisseriaceae bacterium]